MANLDDHYPLHKPNDDVLMRLGKELWGWQLCNKCMNKPACEDVECPWSRRQDLENVWKYYSELTTSYIPETTSAMVLNSHDKFLSIIKAIREHPGWTRAEFMAHCFPRATGQDQGVIVQIDQTRAVDMAATVVFFIDCDCAGSPLTTVDPFRWRPSVRIGDVLKDALRPTTTSSMLYAVTGFTKSRLRRTFSAANLRNNIAGLHFEPTEDLRCHLRFDPRSRALQVCQHTAAMKEVLLTSPPN